MFYHTASYHVVQSLRMRRVYAVKEAAEDVGREDVVAACRRLIWANCLGWRKHADRSDVDLINDIYANIIA